MKRTPMELAAMASAAVPGLAPTGVAGSPDDAADFDSAVLVDEAGKQWRVRSPKHIDASMRLETELLVLRTFVPAVRAELPFALPYVAGTVRQGDLCTFVYSHLPGSTRDIDSLVAESGTLPREVGRAMAAIHSLPHDLVNNADLPSYSANEFRQRKLNELDQAATTGKIPPVLLRRWEHALEDVTLWRFNPSVVHGDLHEDNLLVSNGRISAVTGWTDLRIGDPADDFAWLIAANDPAFTDAVHAAYNAARPETPDPHLIRRAALSAEFALAQWLVRGVAAENSTMIAEAEEMLATLEADILEQEAAAKVEAREAAAAAAENAHAEKAAAVDAALAPAAASAGNPPAGKPAPAKGPSAASAAQPTAKTGVSAGSSRVSVAPIDDDSADAGESVKATDAMPASAAKATGAASSADTDTESGEDTSRSDMTGADLPVDGAPGAEKSGAEGPSSVTRPGQAADGRTSQAAPPTGVISAVTVLPKDSAVRTAPAEPLIGKDPAAAKPQKSGSDKKPGSDKKKSGPLKKK